MIEPKFSVGDRVAVCTSCLCVVMPETFVIDVIRRKAGMRIHPVSRLPRAVDGGWSYRVAGCPHDAEYREECLRPLGPDDYTDTYDESELTPPRQLTAQEN